MVIFEFNLLVLVFLLQDLWLLNKGVSHMKKLILVILIILSLGLCVAVADENNSVKSLWQQFKAEQKIKARSEGAKKLEKGLTKEAVKNLLGFPDSVKDNNWWYESTLIDSEGEVDKILDIQIRFNSENKVDVFLSKMYSAVEE